MFRLKTGYFFTGVATALLILFVFLWTLPDGKLHLVFCNVGQGDGAYIRFPDGRDMVVDGGPDERKIISCLSKHMPFWDRQIDLVLLTHPQKDHLQGLIAVLERYRVDYFLKSEIVNTTDGYKRLIEVIERKKVPVKLASKGEVIDVGKTRMSILWPANEQIVKGKNLSGSVLGISSSFGESNDYSIVFSLRYGTFDAFFTGDADNHVNSNFIGLPLSVDGIEVLKVPHHGSRTGVTDEFLNWLSPKLAVISVGKNNYGHPHSEILEKLTAYGIKILRTDKAEDIEVVSDGNNWEIVGY